jgi:hypothetical protein
MVAATEASNGNGTISAQEERETGSDGAMTVDRMARPRSQREIGTENGGAELNNQSEALLLKETETAQFRSRWDDIQRGFVDEPRKAVEQADTLVAEAIQQLAKLFAEERSKLEEQWSRGGDVSTDDLRVGLQRYRSFFQRLLEI